jgi:anti-sigma B factor antagonist
MSSSPAVYSPKGRIDGTNAGGAEADIKALLDAGNSNLVLDLSGIDYLSSAGLRVVLVAAKGTRAAGGKTVIAGARPAILEILKMSGFDRVIEIAADVDAASRLFS